MAEIIGDSSLPSVVQNDIIILMFDTRALPAQVQV
jgi:hypothetical protein